MHFLFLSASLHLADCLIVTPSTMPVPLYSKRIHCKFFISKVGLHELHTLYQNITSGFACLYFWTCIWSKEACFTSTQRQQVCAVLCKREKTSLLLVGQSELGAQTETASSGSHTMLQVRSPSEFPWTCQKRQNSKYWASSEEILFYENPSVNMLGGYTKEQMFVGEHPLDS